MQTLKFSIIIITWNGIRLLKEFLPSVIASEYANFEIIVADNHSDDETVAWVREYAPEVKVVELDRNYGYAGGNNRAAAAATGDILLFLNNDVAVTKRSEEHTSELQSRGHLVCRLLLEKKNQGSRPNR